MMRRLALTAIFAAGCGAGTPPQPSRPWTMFDIEAAYDVKGQVVIGAEGVPGGLPADMFVSAGRVLPIRPAFTDGEFGAYVTTNLWANVPEVWVQPMYIFVTKWDPNAQAGQPVTTQPWIFTVGPTSRFHSPFWRVYWVEMPDHPPRTTYTSSEQIFADKLILHEGPGRLVPLVPSGTRLGALADTSPWFSKQQAAMPAVRTDRDYLDGQTVTAIDFGVNRFEWNEDLEVIEQPLFILFSCAGDQGCQRAKVPNIGGTGPLFARRPAIAPGGRPRFGSFWRLYAVTLPSDAQLFIPPDKAYDDFREQVANAVYGVKVGALGFTPDPATVDGDVNHHFMQVATDGRTCFADATSFAHCHWLDSQAAVEDNLPAAIARTGITVTCPFVAYDEQAVPAK